MKKNKLYINLFYWLFALYFLWISFYGASILYFHHTNNFYLANPNVPLGIKVIDEVILIFILLLFGLLYKRNIIDLKSNSKLNETFYLTVIPLCILFFTQFLGYISTHDFKYILLAKNYLSAILVTLFLFIIYILNLLKKLTYFLFFILTLSILFGLMHFYFYPYEVYGNRLIGLYANPNVLGYVCFFGLALATYFLDWLKNFGKFYIYIYISILIFAIGLFASGSLSASLILFFFLASKLFFHFILKFMYKSNLEALRNIIKTILIIFFGFFVCSQILYVDVNKEVTLKFYSAFNSSPNITASESSLDNSFHQRLIIVLRLIPNLFNPSDSYLSYTQTDSTVYNFTSNSPVIFFILFVVSFFFSMHQKFLKRKEFIPYLASNPLFYFVFFSIFPFVFVQYVLEEVPSLIYFYFAYTLLALDFYEYKVRKNL
jgi:hypothetical protein